MIFSKFGFDNKETGLVISGSTEKLTPFLEWTESRRVDPFCNLFDCDGEKRHPIDGINHSIDFGPEFQIEFEV